MKTLLSLLVFAAAIFAVLCTVLYVRQDQLLFYPRPNDPELLAQWRTHRVEIPSGKSFVEAWWAENPTASSSAVVIYFGGNAEDVLYTAAVAHRLNARRVLVANYRGYGADKGQPSQSALFEDALTIYDYTLTQAGIAPKDVIAMGRSLGSGVAVWLAANRPLRGVVLITPYENMGAVATRHFRFFPVRLLLKNRFPSDEYAARVKVPVLILAGEQDTLIPPIHAQHLFDVWAGPKDMQILRNASHDNIEQHPQYYALINRFLSDAAAASDNR
jgi:pimeloyl-ACP methyl ester carboxylesterase